MKTILVIEDSADIRENAAEILELEGYNVITAQNGKEGVELAKAELPSVILCDIMMPEMNGYEVLVLLKGNPETEYIPFLYLSASAEKKEIEHAIKMGADGYICKPFELHELLVKVNALANKD
ncbi:response regulator [Dyadobacter psychrotolerans]|uniref:Response regulator n=1 Tax=Dyadobacter psychrotolerans TaxID=2541721 RepID=A0A4R5DVV8_9BACT|nr:response regulator [Dyadobacter psychrotolerans]TDE17997.1 response regulator [Dyadobacter psychrotolerans]